MRDIKSAIAFFKKAPLERKPNGAFSFQSKIVPNDATKDATKDASGTEPKQVNEQVQQQMQKTLQDALQKLLVSVENAQVLKSDDKDLKSVKASILKAIEAPTPKRMLNLGKQIQEKPELQESLNVDETDYWKLLEREFTHLNGLDIEGKELEFSDTLKDDSLSAIEAALGPAGPLIHLVRQLKGEYLKDGVKAAWKDIIDSKNRIKDKFKKYYSKTLWVRTQGMRLLEKTSKFLKGKLSSIDTDGNSRVPLKGKWGAVAKTLSFMSNHKEEIGAGLLLAGTMAATANAKESKPAQTKVDKPNDTQATQSPIVDEKQVAKIAQEGSKKIGGAVSDQFDETGKWMTEPLSKDVADITEQSDKASTLWDKLKLDSKTAKDVLQKGSLNLWEDAKGIFNTIWEKIKGFIPTFASDTITAVGGAISGAADAVREFFGGTGSGASVIENASSMLGATKGKDNSQIAAYLKHAGFKWNGEAWCAEFVNASLAKSGLKGTGSAAAASFLKWGSEVDRSSGVRPGDVALMTRKGGSGYHVGLLTGQTSGTGAGQRYEFISGNSGATSTVSKKMIRAGVFSNIRRGITEADDKKSDDAPVANSAKQPDKGTVKPTMGKGFASSGGSAGKGIRAGSMGSAMSLMPSKGGINSTASMPSIPSIPDIPPIPQSTGGWGGSPSKDAGNMTGDASWFDKGMSVINDVGGLIKEGKSVIESRDFTRLPSLLNKPRVIFDKIKDAVKPFNHKTTPNVNIDVIPLYVGDMDMLIFNMGSNA